MGSLEQLYQQVILDHAREKHGEGDPCLQKIESLYITKSSATITIK